MRKTLFALLLVFSARPLLAQAPPEGLWQGYDGEWRHVSSQLLVLAEVMPEEKFAWRPAPGVRSTSEVFMHIALANFYLLSVTGPKMPADMKERLEKSVTSKADVISWLKRSLDAVKSAHLAVTPKDLERRSEEHTSELQSQSNLVCRLLLEKKKYICTTPLSPIP